MNIRPLLKHVKLTPNILVRTISTKEPSPSAAHLAQRRKEDTGHEQFEHREKWQKKTTKYSVAPDPVSTCMTFEEHLEHCRKNVFALNPEVAKYDILPSFEMKAFQALGQRGGINYETINLVRTIFGGEGTSMEDLIDDARHDALIDDQKFLPERVKALGPDLAAAHFIIYRGGRVRFHNDDKWYVKDKYDESDLPSLEEPGWKLREVDASDMRLYYNGLDNFKNCDHLEILNLSGNQNVNSFFIDRICHHLSDSLTTLDISKCKNINLGGITALVRLRKLRHLNVSGIKIPHLPLACISIEEENPHLQIVGVQYKEPQLEPQERKVMEESLGI